MSTSYLSSPDQPSSIYPDRLIRPLPKRSIKSRLSQEAADAITYPPNPPSATLPSYPLYGEAGEILIDGKHVAHGSIAYSREHEHDHDHDHSHGHEHEHHHDHDNDEEDDEHCAHHHHHRCHHDHHDDEFDSADESSPVALRQSSTYRSSTNSPRSRHQRYGSYNGKASGGPDGYEAFENTNNKKKRKIPTSGTLSLHHSSLTNELASMGLNPGKEGEDTSHYMASSASGMGMQGAGRGRNGRKSYSRNPLGVSVNGSNARNIPSKYDQNAIMAPQAEEIKPDQGIISTAIANATALLRNPLGKGQENLGVLDHQAKSTPTNSQFTFTCGSEAKGLKFPEQSLYSPDYSQRVNASSSMTPAVPYQKFSTHATQTSPSMPTQGHQQMPAPQHSMGQNGQGKKIRRKKGDVYALAARQRKLQQEYMNLQHPPATEDIWICEFCEYESIFGEAPRALIRQYEIKDRRERKRLAEKQRLLEKAKLKGRKGKKQTKNAAKAASQAAQQPINQQSFDQQPIDHLGDDYLDDGYDDDPVPAPGPPTQANIRQQVEADQYSNVHDKSNGGPVDRGGTG